MRYRLAIRYAIEGDLRFLSHQDSLRLFHRAFARADLPIRYSEGFNPRPRISIVMPRPVGVASHDERMVVELSAPVAEEDVQRRLSAETPDGIRILSVQRLGLQDRCVPTEAEYVLPLADSALPDVERACADFMAKPNLMVERPALAGRRRRQVDVRGFIIDMRVSAGRLIWRQTISQDGTARVGEVLDAVGLPSREWTHRVIRHSAAFRDECAIPFAGSNQ
ncbi:MAG TPA: TIGR03936 family radical SAM-associated protein [Phycisphaerae bacterium]|nr:TIGR03936 family radical SAM-associated protein [Phycisphaerae bacterium]